MSFIDVHEAKAHFSRLLAQVGRGEPFTITKQGRPVAVLSPVQSTEAPSISAVIAEFRAYSREHARKHGSLSAEEIKEMIIVQQRSLMRWLDFPIDDRQRSCRTRRVNQPMVARRTRRAGTARRESPSAAPR